MKDDDLIENKGPKVLAWIKIEIVETAPGATGLRVEQDCKDEIQAMGMLEKGKDTIKMLLAQAAMKKVLPANGFPLPDALRRRINRG